MNALYTEYNYGLGRHLYAYNPMGWKGDSSPFLCVHGWLDNHGSFLPLLERIPNLPWIAIDLMGHGKSRWRNQECFYSFQDYVCDLGLWIEHYLPNQKIHLIGHSLGAAIVSILAGLYPDKVESLVLFDGAGPLVSDEETMCEQFRRSLHQFISPRPLREYSCLDTAAAARKKKHLINIETCQILAQHGVIQKANGLYQWGFDPKLLGLAPFQMTEPEVLNILRHIDAPTLLVRPLDGYPYPQELMQKRLHALKKLTYVCTPGGHHAHCDHPEESAKILKDFYKQMNFL